MALDGAVKRGATALGDLKSDHWRLIDSCKCSYHKVKVTCQLY